MIETLRLCLLAPIILTSDDGTLRINGNYGRLIADLARRLGTIDVVAGLAEPGDPTYYPEGRSLYTFPLASENVQAVIIRASTPSMSPLAKSVVWVSRVLPFARAIHRADLAFITMPGFSGVLAWLLCRLMRKPYILYYGSDWQSLAPFVAKWGEGGSLWLPVYRRFAAWVEGRPVRGSSFTLVAGKRLLERLRPLGVRVFETNPMVWLRPSDFYDRADTCQNPQITVLSVGSLIPLKGVHHLLEAIQLTRENRVDATLILVGPADPDYLAKLKEQVRADSLGKWVTFAGYVTEPELLLRLYRQADIFVLATLSEGFPRVLYEAMSQGLPVVTTSIPAIASALRHGEEAVLVDPGSPAALASAIQRVASDGATRRRLIQGGYTYARMKLSTSTLADRIVGLLEDYGPHGTTREGLRRWARRYYTHSTAYEQRLTSKWAGGWEKVFANYVQRLVDLGRMDDLVLDLGCGGGQTTDMLRAAGRKVVGADLFLRVLRQFPPERRSPRLSLVNCDAAHLPFREGAFVAVGSYAMLEHVPDAERVLDEMVRVLGRKGGLVIAGPNMLSPFHAFRLWLEGFRTRKRHPDGTLGAALWRLAWSIRKALSPRYRFLYRQPNVRGLEFPGSDYDAVCMISPIDLVRWARSKGLIVEGVAEASSRGGKAVRLLFPYLAGGICLVARRTTSGGA